MGQAVIDETAALLCAGVDELLTGDLSGLGGAGTIALVKAVEAQRNRLAAVDARLLCELSELRLNGEIGAMYPADVLVSECRATPGEARARMAAARDLGPRRTLTGELLKPVFPRVAAALAEGAISPLQAKVVRDTLHQVPRDMRDVATPIAEAVLVRAARHEDVRGLRVTAAELLARLDPDGKQPDEDRAERRRAFTLRPGGDGSYDLAGRFTAETAAIWLAILDPLAKPQPVKDDDGKITCRDQRSAGQRRHDAMRDAGLRLLRSGTLPDCGGTPTTILVKVRLADLLPDYRADFLAGAGFGRTAVSDADRAAVNDILTGANGGARANTGARGGVAQTQHGGLMSVRMMMHLACEANIIPVVLDNLGGIMAFGRDKRSASPGQRYALTVRDGGCCFPQCDRPASWTEVHHIREWVNGGRTDIDNLCLLCSHHHRSFQRDGWTVEMCQGRPQWIPPPWLDPERKPRRNTAHHLDDIVFEMPTELASA